MAGVMFLEYSDRVEGIIEREGPYQLQDSPYLFTAYDNKNTLSLSFQDWVHNGLLNGLVMWQQKI